MSLESLNNVDFYFKLYCQRTKWPGVHNLKNGF